MEPLHESHQGRKRNREQRCHEAVTALITICYALSIAPLAPLVQRWYQRTLGACNRRRTRDIALIQVLRYMITQFPSEMGFHQAMEDHLDPEARHTPMLLPPESPLFLAYALANLARTAGYLWNERHRLALFPEAAHGFQAIRTLVVRQWYAAMRLPHYVCAVPTPIADRLANLHSLEAFVATLMANRLRPLKMKMNVRGTAPQIMLIGLIRWALVSPHSFSDRPCQHSANNRELPRIDPAHAIENVIDAVRNDVLSEVYRVERQTRLDQENAQQDGKFVQAGAHKRALTFWGRVKAELNALQPAGVVNTFQRLMQAVIWELLKTLPVEALAQLRLTFGSLTVPFTTTIHMKTNTVATGPLLLVAMLMALVRMDVSPYLAYQAIPQELFELCRFNQKRSVPNHLVVILPYDYLAMVRELQDAYSLRGEPPSLVFLRLVFEAYKQKG